MDHLLGWKQWMWERGSCCREVAVSGGLTVQKKHYTLCVGQCRFHSKIYILGYWQSPQVKTIILHTDCLCFFLSMKICLLSNVVFHIWRGTLPLDPAHILFYAYWLCMNYIIAMLLLVSCMRMHNHLLYFARFCAGSTLKIANKKTYNKELWQVS